MVAWRKVLPSFYEISAKRTSFTIVNKSKGKAMDKAQDNMELSFYGKVMKAMKWYDEGHCTQGQLARNIFKLCIESGFMNLTHPAIQAWANRKVA